MGWPGLLAPPSRGLIGASIGGGACFREARTVAKDATSPAVGKRREDSPGPGGGGGGGGGGGKKVPFAGLRDN